MIALVALAFILLLNLPALHAQPLYDDQPYFLDPDNFKWDWKWLKKGYNRSLSTATLRATFCFIPTGFQITFIHLTQALLHFIVTMEVFGLTGALSLPENEQHFVVLVVAVCPVAYSAVAPIATRAVLVSSVFTTLALWLMVSGHPVLALLVCIPAIASREDAILTVPVILMYTALERPFTALAIAGGLLLIALPWWRFLLSLVRHKLRNNGDQGMGWAGFTQSFPQPEYSLTAFTENLLRFPCWMVGLRQNPDPFIQPVRVWSWSFLLALFIAGGFLFIASHNTLALLLIVVSPWVGSWFFRLPDVVAENRAYSTIPGVALLLTPIAGYPNLATLFILWLSYRALMRSWIQRDGVTYWKKAWSEKTPKLRVAVNIGAAYQTIGDMANAERWHQKAIALSPSNGIAWANLALWHEGMARIARRDRVAMKLIEFGVCQTEDVQQASEESNNHMNHALELMHKGRTLAPQEPVVRNYAARILHHAQTAGIAVASHIASSLALNSSGVD